MVKEDGWVYKDTEGDHYHFVHPTKQGKITIPHPRKDLTPFEVWSIERQSGLKLLKQKAPKKQK